MEQNLCKIGAPSSPDGKLHQIMPSKFGTPKKHICVHLCLSVAKNFYENIPL